MAPLPQSWERGKRFSLQRDLKNNYIPWTLRHPAAIIVRASCRDRHEGPPGKLNIRSQSSSPVAVVHSSRVARLRAMLLRGKASGTVSGQLLRGKPPGPLCLVSGQLFVREQMVDRRAKRLPTWSGAPFSLPGAQRCSIHSKARQGDAVTSDRESGCRIKRRLVERRRSDVFHFWDIK